MIYISIPIYLILKWIRISGPSWQVGPLGQSHSLLHIPPIRVLERCLALRFFFRDFRIKMPRLHPNPCATRPLSASKSNCDAKLDSETSWRACTRLCQEHKATSPRNSQSQTQSGIQIAVFPRRSWRNRDRSIEPGARSPLCGTCGCDRWLCSGQSGRWWPVRGGRHNSLATVAIDRCLVTGEEQIAWIQKKLDAGYSIGNQG